MRSTTQRGLFFVLVTGLIVSLFTMGAWAQSITLQPHLVPAPGSEAVFTIVETYFTGLTERSGIFVHAPVEEPEESARAVRVKYTVLEPDDDGRPVVMVQARAIDPDTKQPIRGVVWEAFYLVTPDQLVYDFGGRVPGDYEDLVVPEWLVDWSLTSLSELPKDALSPGDVWGSVPDDFIGFMDDFAVEDMDMHITGEFVGWQDVAGASDRVAHIRETMEGASISLAPLAEDVPGLVTYEMTATSDYHLIPGDFPHESRQELIGGMLISVGTESGAPEELDGRIAYGFRYTRVVERDQSGSLDWLIVSEEDEIEGLLRRGDAVEAYLGAEDSFVFGDGTYADLYVLVGEAEETYTIRLESAELDAYLFVVSDEDELIAAEELTSGDPAVVTFTFDYTGEYFIFVNSIFQGDSGTYVLSVE